MDLVFQKEKSMVMRAARDLLLERERWGCVPDDDTEELMSKCSLSEKNNSKKTTTKIRLRPSIMANDNIMTNEKEKEMEMGNFELMQHKGKRSNQEAAEAGLRYTRMRTGGSQVLQFMDSSQLVKHSKFAINQQKDVLILHQKVV